VHAWARNKRPERHTMRTMKQPLHTAAVAAAFSVSLALSSAALAQINKSSTGASPSKVATATTSTTGSGVNLICQDCGTVSSVKARTVKGKGTGIGAVGGAVVGGVLGNQIGGGSGKKIATVGGAVAGGVAGHQIERNVRKKTVYDVVVKLDNGNTRTFTFSQLPGYAAGDKVKVQGNTVARI
jgi:outer membrane lipoprotein SlyB